MHRETVHTEHNHSTSPASLQPISGGRERGQKLSRTTASDWRRACPNRFGGWSLQRRSANGNSVGAAIFWYLYQYSFHSFQFKQYQGNWALPSLQLSMEDSRDWTERRIIINWSVESRCAKLAVLRSVPAATN